MSELTAFELAQIGLGDDPAAIPNFIRKAISTPVEKSDAQILDVCPDASPTTPHHLGPYLSFALKKHPLVFEAWIAKAHEQDIELPHTCLPQVFKLQEFRRWLPRFHRAFGPRALWLYHCLNPQKGDLRTLGDTSPGNLTKWLKIAMQWTPGMARVYFYRWIFDVYKAEGVLAVEALLGANKKQQDHLDILSALATLPDSYVRTQATLALQRFAARRYTLEPVELATEVFPKYNLPWWKKLDRDDWLNLMLVWTRMEDWDTRHARESEVIDWQNRILRSSYRELMIDPKSQAEAILRISLAKRNFVEIFYSADPLLNRHMAPMLSALTAIHPKPNAAQLAPFFRGYDEAEYEISKAFLMEVSREIPTESEFSQTWRQWGAKHLFHSIHLRAIKERGDLVSVLGRCSPEVAQACHEIVSLREKLFSELN